MFSEFIIFIRLGQLKAGDKILTINGISLEGVTLHTAIKLANEMKECVTMTVEFEVEGTSFLTIHVISCDHSSDPVIPKVGSLDIKLVKIGMSLGITINGNRYCIYIMTIHYSIYRCSNSWCSSMDIRYEERRGCLQVSIFLYTSQYTGVH